MDEMMMFSQQFQYNDSFEITYKGHRVNAFYKFDKVGKYKLRFYFISVSSPYNQAIVLHLDEFKGRLFIDGDELSVPKNKFPQIIFEEKYAPRSFDLEVVLDSGNITICNGSDLLGTEEIWCTLDLGCAMIIETINDKHYRFHCNDHDNDDDFDDLIFEVELLKM